NPYAYVHGSPFMGVDPDGRFVPLVFVAIVLASAAIAAAANYVQQGEAKGYNNVDAGGVATAFGVGLVTGAVSGGGGGLVSGAVTGALGGGALATAIGGATGGLAGGLAGGAAGYGLNHVDGSGTWRGLGQSMLISGVGGLAGGASSTLSGSPLTNAVIS